MKKSLEKRGSDRWDLEQPVTFELTVLSAGILTNLMADGVGIDLSAGGMGLVTEYPLQGGEVLKIFFPVTQGEARLPILTEVMWAAPNASRYRTGLRFLV